MHCDISNYVTFITV